VLQQVVVESNERGGINIRWIWMNGDDEWKAKAKAKANDTADGVKVKNKTHTQASRIIVV